MKKLCTFLGCIFGIIVYSAICNYNVFLSSVAFFGVVYLGRFIGSSIEKISSIIEEERIEEAEKQREWQRKKDKATRLVKLYPYATKIYFIKYWGIEKDFYSQYDVTDDKVEKLLSLEKEYASLNEENDPEIQYKKRKEAVINAAISYPHAFASFCQQYLRGYSLINAPAMPGDKYRKKTLDNYLISNGYSIHDGIMKRFRNELDFKNKWNYDRKVYDTLYGKLKSFPEEECRILKIMHIDEVNERFSRQILSNKNRSEKYKDFCDKNIGISATDEQRKDYCLQNLSALDSFITTNIQKQYDNLKAKYPQGLDAFEKKYSSFSKEQLVSKETEIEIYQKNYKLARHDEEWVRKQKDFFDESRKLRNQFLPNYGCYFYNIPLNITRYNGNKENVDYSVWQIFYSSFCSVDGLEYSYYPQALQRRSNVDLIRKRTSYFLPLVYNRIISFIEEIKQMHSNTVVAIAGSGLPKNESKSFSDYHTAYLREQLSNKQISFFYVEDLKSQPLKELCQFVVVVEIITENENIEKVCAQILDNCKKSQPGIVYISLYKDYSKQEMEKLIRCEKQKKEAEESAKREEEAKKEIERRENARKEEEYKTLKSYTNNWMVPSYGSTKYFSLYNYYPTTCQWDANQDEWNIRNIIWNFKASPNKPISENKIIHDHQNSVSIVEPLFCKSLRFFFKTDISKLTLVCLPSSKAVVTRRRYEDFSEMLCRDLGMDNAYSHVRVTKDGEAKHTGGTIPAEYAIDDYYFKGRYVLLFDDVITSGKTLYKWTSKLESAGAKVIGAVSIGRTRHERQGLNPINDMDRFGTYQ